MRLFLCGDVMTGRGIDQVLRHPGDPRIHEGYLQNAFDYMRLAERASGAIPRGVDDAYIWGDALEEFARAKPDARIINLETAVTRSDDWMEKGINYRMHPANVGCLTAAGTDCCTLANNHVLAAGKPRRTPPSAFALAHRTAAFRLPGRRPRRAPASTSWPSFRSAARSNWPSAYARQGARATWRRRSCPATPTRPRSTATSNP